MSVHRHFVLYKPDGYLSQFIYNESTRKNRKLLGELFDFAQGSMAIGRLDQASEGLLLVTTDGKQSEYIRSRAVEKEYYAQVDGLIDLDAVKKLSSGVEISTEDGHYMTKPCPVRILPETPRLPPRARKIRDERHGPTSWVSVTLTEGKFRQVRKMTAAVGFPTLRLVRVRIGNILLSEMQPGDAVEVDNFEV